MAAITDQVQWRRMLNHVAADLKMLASLAAGSEIIVNQATPANLQASVQQLPGVVGVWPPAGYTPIVIDNYVNGDNALDIYSTLEGKLVYITSAWLTSRLSDNAAAESHIRVVDGFVATKYKLVYHRFDKAGQQTTMHRYSPAIAMPYQWGVIIESSHDDMDIRAGFAGWIEDV